MPTTSDFSGVFVGLAPSATAANNAAGQIVTIQSNRFLSMGPVDLGGTTAQNDRILVRPLFSNAGVAIEDAAKTAGEAWTAGQTLYLISATNVYTTTKGTNLVGGIALADAASAATVGRVLPATVLVTAV